MEAEKVGCAVAVAVGGVGLKVEGDGGGGFLVLQHDFALALDDGAGYFDNDSVAVGEHARKKSEDQDVLRRKPVTAGQPQAHGAMEPAVGGQGGDAPVDLKAIATVMPPRDRRSDYQKQQGTEEDSPHRVRRSVSGDWLGNRVHLSSLLRSALPIFCWIAGPDASVHIESAPLHGIDGSGIPCRLRRKTIRRRILPMSHELLSRRHFVGLGLGTVVAAKAALLPAGLLRAQTKSMAPSDRVRFAVIGTGVRGCNLLTASLSVPGGECVAVSDLYDSRHQAAKEALRRDVPAGRSYKEILDRKDVDAVLIAVADHQHRRIVLDALSAGKDVYCEKPMSHTVADGFAMVDAVKSTGRVMQVGSQRVSSVLFAKAKEIYDSGQLGEVYSIEASLGRNSASGAWVYPIPPDASAQTIDWDAFLGDAPRRPFDPVRFFRWRCFTDYGEGLAGDLFVHLISGVMFVMGTNAAPLRAQSSGGIFRWKDGREYPDVIETLYDYPNFTMTVRCTLNNDSGDFTAFYGTKGTMVIHDSTVTFTPQETQPQPENYSTQGWPAELRAQYLKQWYQEHPNHSALEFAVKDSSESFTTPKGYDDTSDHEANFFNSVRSRKSPVENEVFGNHAAIACHLSNYSYFHKTAASFDEAGRTIKS